MTTPQSINLTCSAIALLVGAGIFVRYWLNRAAARRAAELQRLPTDQQIRSYSVYIEGYKIGTCKDASLVLDDDETQLSFSQIVPLTARHYRLLQRAFRRRETVSVMIAPIDDDALQLGAMRVLEIVLNTDIATGSTTMETTLSGPTLVMPLGIQVAVATPDPEAISAAFDAIDQRAAKAHSNITDAR